MERLWRPWRMVYIAGAERESTCFLCDTGDAAASAGDEENLVVVRGEHAFVILNKYPYNSGHLMVAPYRHAGDLNALDPRETAEIWDLVKRSIDAHRATSNPHGFNIGINLGEAAGAGVPGHVHVHIVPRWSGDTNFMPVLGETKVMPEMLSDTYRMLRPAFGEDAG